MKILTTTATSNAAAIGDLQAAIDQLPAEGGAIYLPAGRYEIDKTVRCKLKEGQHLHLYGDGRATVIHYTATDGSPFLELDGVPSWWPDLRITIRDLTVCGTPQCGDAFLLHWPNDALIDSCAFFGFGGTAVTVTPAATNVTIRDCWMRDCKRALHADNLHHLTFHGNQTRSINGGQTQKEQVYIGKHCREIRIVNNHFAYGHAEAIILDGTAQHVVANNTIEGFPCGIRAIDCRDITINGNYLHCPTGILIQEDTRGMIVNANIFTNNNETAVKILPAHNSGGHVITANVMRQSVYSDGQQGIDLGGAAACVVAGNVVEDLSPGATAVDTRGASQANLANNIVSDCAQRVRENFTGKQPDCPLEHPFQALHAWLKSRAGEMQRCVLTFWELKKILGTVPPEAETNTAWWANDPHSPQAAAWLAAGWLVVITKRIEGRVVFARMQKG